METNAAEREQYKKSQRQWLRTERDRCIQAQCLGLVIWQHSTMLRATLESAGQVTTDVPEVADTAQTLENLIAREEPSNGRAEPDTLASAAALEKPREGALAVATPPTAPAWDTEIVGAPLQGMHIWDLAAVRLGRCAARFAQNNNYDRVRQLIGISTHREVSHATYVAVRLQYSDDAKEATRNWNDACGALGLNEGGSTTVAFRFWGRLTAYEAARPELQPAGAALVAKALDARVRARDRATQQSLAAHDPVNDLRAAYSGASAACKTAYQGAFGATMKQVQQLRQNAQLMPAYSGDLNNPAERSARGLASTLLQGMRANGCAKPE